MPLQDLEIYEFGPFRLDGKERTLRRGADNVTLTPKVFDLLLLLVENRGKLLEKEYLLKTLWPDTFVEEANLSVNISTLRRALGQPSTELTFIETVPKRGYRFVAPVRKGSVEAIIEKEPITSFEPLFIQSQGPGSTSEKPESVAVLRRNDSVLAVSAGLLVIAGIALWAYTRPVQKSQHPLRSLAVLPFRSLTAQADEERLGAGMANALIRRLTNARKITVRPASAVLRYTNRDIDAVEAGKRLKVDAVLDGTVQREADKIRVDVQLLRVFDGASLWADYFEDYFTNIFAVQDSISEMAAKKLSMKLSELEMHWMNKRYTESTQAYSAYLQGQYYANLRTKRDTLTAVDYFLKAIGMDPDFALAYSELAAAYVTLAGTGQYNGAWEKAQSTAQKAIQLDSSLAEAHLALGRVYMRRDWNWEGAEREFRKAIEIDPNYAVAHSSLSTLRTAFGRHEDAISEMLRACELDPQSASHRSDLAWTYYCARKNREAIESSELSLLLDASSDVAHRQLELEYRRSGRYGEALEQYQVAHDPKSQQGSGSVADLAMIYAASGREQDAEQIYRNLQKLPNPETISNYSHVMAVLAANLGHIDESFSYLKAAQMQKLARTIWMRVDPDLEPLHPDPRFKAILKAAKLLP